MQVYREIPRITNQARERPAELLGIVSVTEDWTMARHRVASDAVVDATRGPFVLDAGTGMYLNALLLDIPIYPRVDAGTRQKATSLSRNAVNPRRTSREKELTLAGVLPEGSRRGSIWNGELRYQTSVIYLRPEKSALDAAIEKRTRKISRTGIEEAAVLESMLQRGAPINSSVLGSIGVRELIARVRGGIEDRDVEESIVLRTRQLARRQVRWFDKLMKTLHEKPGVFQVSVLEDASRLDVAGSLASLHDS